MGSNLEPKEIRCEVGNAFLGSKFDCVVELGHSVTDCDSQNGDKDVCKVPNDCDRQVHPLEKRKLVTANFELGLTASQMTLKLL